MSERDGPRTLADREQSRRSLEREQSRRVSQREWDAFLETLYRALLMITRWIERRRETG